MEYRFAYTAIEDIFFHISQETFDVSLGNDTNKTRMLVDDVFTTKQSYGMKQIY